MDDHSQIINDLDQAARALELPKVLQSIALHTITPMAAHRIANADYFDTISAVDHALAEISDFRGLLDSGEDVVIEYFESLDNTFEVLRLEGAVTTPDKLIALARLAGNGRHVIGFMRSRKEQCPNIWQIAQNLQPLKHFEEAVHRALDAATGEVLDSASSELRKIRKDIAGAQQRVRQKLESILKSSKQDMLRDQLISLREGRQVLMVKDEYRRKIKGIVHDQSATGQTYFIEPMETVELNNSVRQLEAKERAEIERIIAALSVLANENLFELRTNYECLIALDTIRAKALFSQKFRCNAANVSDSGKIRLEFARHPLLLEKYKKQEDVVPLTIKLGARTHTLVITGPNSGGKTVAMKTVGLLTLMTRLGLHVPASPDSEIGIWGMLFVDIGDEQSIEDDLSTFTSHMARLRTMLDHAKKGDLILIDEMGSGTDPDEGTALALASLAELTDRGVISIVTTHHGALKEFAHNTEGVDNGCMVFDLDTLRPTYRFRHGVPGSSYAFEIASRVGLSRTIIKNARELVGTEKGRVERLIADLEAKLHKQEELVRKNELEKIRLQGLMNVYNERAEELKKNKRKLQEEAVAESEKMLQNANAAVELAIREIREGHASREAIQQAKALLNEQKNEMITHKKALKKEGVTKKDAPVDKSKIAAGMQAMWMSQRIQVTILDSPDADERVTIQAGSMRLKVAISDLELSKKKAKKARVTANYNTPPPVMQELDLRGKRADEAISDADRFLSEAMMHSWDEVRLVHGKGTGALRKALSEFLQTHPSVRDFGPAALGQGDVGVTCVRFK